MSESIENGAIKFNEGSDSDGSLKIEITCDDGFEPEQPVECKVETDSGDENVSVVKPTPMCVESRRRALCGIYCYVPVIVAVCVLLILILLLIIILLVVCCYYRRKHNYYPQKREIAMKRPDSPSSEEGEWEESTEM